MADSVIEAWETFIAGCRKRAVDEREHARRRQYLAGIVTDKEDSALLLSMVDTHLSQALVESDLARLGEDKMFQRQRQISI